MYAIIELGAKQYSVKKDDIIEVEKMAGETGQTIALDKILLVSDGDNVEVGQPYLKKAGVSVEVLGEAKGEKVVSFKYRRRKASHWTKGHRQQLTRLKVTDISLGK